MSVWSSRVAGPVVTVGVRCGEETPTVYALSEAINLTSDELKCGCPVTNVTFSTENAHSFATVFV